MLAPDDRSWCRPVVALTYWAVGAVFGLTCSECQSGEIDRSGAISRCGDEMMRTMLYNCGRCVQSRPEHAVPFDKMALAQGLGDADCQPCGMKKAVVALARRLAA